MNNAAVTINGKNFPLLLSTRATKNIAARYGGIENLGEKLLKSKNFEAAIDEIVWLVCELANQYILASNLLKETKQPLLKEEEVELLTTPYDLAAFKDAILAALNQGMERSIHSEPSKNTKAG